MRWQFARVLANSQFADKGWEVLRVSIPRSDFFLVEWLNCCEPYASYFQRDAQLQAVIHKRLSQMGSHEVVRDSCWKIYRELSSKCATTSFAEYLVRELYWELSQHSAVENPFQNVPPEGVVVVEHRGYEYLRVRILDMEYDVTLSWKKDAPPTISRVRRDI